VGESSRLIYLLASDPELNSLKSPREGTVQKVFPALKNHKREKEGGRTFLFVECSDSTGWKRPLQNLGGGRMRGSDKRLTQARYGESRDQYRLQTELLRGS